MSPRRSVRRQAGALVIPTDPHRYLAIAVIGRALDDLCGYGVSHAMKEERRRCTPDETDYESALRFLRGDEIEGWLDLAGLSHDDIEAEVTRRLREIIGEAEQVQ